MNSKANRAWQLHRFNEVNARYEHARSPAERLAAIASAVVRSVSMRWPRGCAISCADVADFLEVFAPYVARELVEAKLDEALLFENPQRVWELERELAHAKDVIDRLTFLG